METKELKNLIKSNTIPSCLIFDVENSFLCRQYLDLMASTLNKPLKFYNTADEVLYEISTNLREDFLYVVFNDDSVIKKDAYIDELKKLNRNIVVYLFDVDRQSDFYKAHKSDIVQFPKIDKYSIVAYLMNQLKIHKIEVEQTKVEKLVDYCNCDYSCCVNELDKIIVLDQANSNLVFDYMLTNGFSDFRKINIFSFVNKVLSKNKEVFEEVVKIDEQVIYVLNLIYKSARKRFIESSNFFYIDIMQLCIELDSSIKDGTLSDKYALDYLLLRVFNGK